MKRVISICPLIFVRPSISASVRLSFIIKLVTTSSPKPLNGFISNFYGMFPLNRLSSYERHIQVPLGCTTIHAIFLITVRRIRMFFSLKPFLFHGESSLEISAGWFAVSEELGNKQTDSLTDWRFYRVILKTSNITFKATK